MSITIDRGLLTHTVVVLGMCVGAWMMLVQPQMKGLRAAEAALAAEEKAQQDVSDHLFEKTVQKMKDVKSRIAEIERCNGLMHDSSRLYGSIMDLAAMHGVTIQNLQPGSEKLSADAKTSVNRIDLSAEGAFDKVASFLDAIIELDGFIRPVSLNVVPTRDEANPTVIAHFSCDAVSFKLPEALAGMGGDHAKP